MSPPAIKSTGDHTGSPLHARSDLDANIRSILMRLPYLPEFEEGSKQTPVCALP